MKNADKKAVVLDLDGTLLNSRHQVSPLARQVLNELVAQDIKVVLASARPIRAVLDTALEIGLRGEGMIGGNGAIICSMNRDILYHQTMAKEDLLSVFSLFQEFQSKEEGNPTLHLYSAFQWFVPVNTPRVREEAQILGFEPDLVGEQAYHVKHVDKAMFVAHPYVVKKFATALQEKLTEGVSLVLSKPTSLEVTKQGVSKFSGVQAYARLVQLPVSAFVAMGDGDNDAEMLAGCGYGVAMGNASAKARVAAMEVLPWSNDDDGVARFLKKFFSLV